MNLMDASRTKAKAMRARFSKSLASRRQRPNQAKVRSTIRRLGRTLKPVTSMDQCRPPFFGAFDALAIDDGDRRAGLAPRAPRRRARDGYAAACRPSSTDRDIPKTVVRGGKSLGSVRHWQPVERV